MMFIPAFSCCTIKSIELYSENDKFYSNYPRYFLKIALNYDDGKNKGTVVIPKVSLPIHPDPKYWGWEQEYSDGCIPRTTLDPCGCSDFEILPDEEGRLVYEEWTHRELSKEEIEKILGYSINIKGIRECPCEKKEKKK